MPKQKSGFHKQRIRPRFMYRGDLGIFCLISLLVFALLLIACVPPQSAPTESTVQRAQPTPTLEPTFTPSPSSPTNTPLATPTDTPTSEPSPTSVPQVGLSGLIFDQSTNQPIAEAQVSVGDQTTTTNDKGRYSLTGIGPGQYVLAVTHPDYDPGLSRIFTLVGGQDRLIDLALYASDTSPYPQDPMLTNPLDPNGTPTKEDAERLAREQGLTGEVVSIKEIHLSGEYLVNYKIGDNFRAAVAELNHEVWELTDDAGRTWWIIKVCGNLASLLPAQKPIPTPNKPISQLMAEVVVDELSVRACTSEECAEVGTVPRGGRVEVFGCLADKSWCEVSLSGGRGWCTGQSLQQLAVATAIPIITPESPKKEKIAFLSTRDYQNEPAPSYEVYLMNPDGSQQTTFTKIGLSQYSCTLTWLPEHQQLFYTDCSDSSQIINLSDGSASSWQFPASSNGSFAQISPDRNKLVYVQRDTATWNIFVANIDEASPQQLSNFSDGELANTPSWSPNGDKIAFGLQSGSTHSFWVMNDDGSGKVKLADVFARLSAWSLDGQRIVFECGIPGVTQFPNQDICVINSDGTNLIRLTNSIGQQVASHPTWSPDSTKIAFYIQAGASATASKQIYVVNADGTNLTQLTFDGNNCCPAWSR